MNIEKLKLYHYPATRSARVRWALLETVGDNFQIELVPLYDGVQFDEEYSRINPNHCVPTLEITFANGAKINMIESSAMVELLVDACPEKQLAPPPQEISFQRVDYLQMLHFGATSMDMMLWQIRIHEHILPISERDERSIERYRSKFVQEVEPQLKSRLETAPFICGDEFSGADFIIAHNVMWARKYHLCTDKVFRQYLSRVARRPAFKSAFSDAHEFTAEVPEGNPIINKFTG